MKVNREKLLSDIKQVKGMASTETELDQVLTNLKFEKGTLCAFNKSVGITIPCSIEESFIVNAKKFSSVVEGLKTEEIDLLLEDNVLMIKSKSSKVKLSLNSIDSFPNIKREFKETEEVPSDLLEGIKFCLINVKKGIGRIDLEGISFDDNFLVSGDENRVSVFKLDKKVFNCLITEELANRLLENELPIGMIMHKNILYFNYENEKQLMGNLVGVDFPKWKNLFDIKETKKVSVELKDIKKAKESLKRICSFASASYDNEPIVSVIGKENKLFLSYRDRKDEIKETILCNKLKEEIDFSTNAVHLLQILDFCDMFYFIEEKNCLYFYTKDKKYRHLIALVIKEKKK